VNSQLAFGRSMVVEEVNGHVIRSLADLAAAFEGNTGPVDLIRFQGQGEVEVVDHAEAQAARQRILDTYGIAKDRRL
ncbi:MAG: hypothetical protein RL199_1954, partial [Pseudomonadota bacterium]